MYIDTRSIIIQYNQLLSTLFITIYVAIILKMVVNESIVGNEESVKCDNVKPEINVNTLPIIKIIR